MGPGAADDGQDSIERLHPCERRIRRTVSDRSLKPSLEWMESRVLLATFIVTNTSDTNSAGSLRYAINQSNMTPGSNVIDFNIANSGVQSIHLTSGLPGITVPVTIDGTTEPGYAGTPLIELNGTGAGGNVNGLNISAGNTTIEGLAINRFGGEGIDISVAGDDTITKDFIGTDPTGATAEGNLREGVFIRANANSNTISANVISGNQNNGVHLDGSASGSSTTSTSGDLIAGNIIGLDVTGTVVLGSVGVGIYVQNAPMTTIGGTTPADRNIVSGNGAGMQLYDNSDGSVIEGNYVGTDVTGTVALGNNLAGGFLRNNIAFFGMSNSTVGGTAPGPAT